MGSSGNNRSGNGLRILIIEDEQKLAGAIAEGLEGNGYEVALAESGEGGVKQSPFCDASIGCKPDNSPSMSDCICGAASAK